MPERSDEIPPGVDTNEAEALVAFLDYVRAAVWRKARGLTEAQGRAPGVPSGTSLVGLVRHLTESERYWFEWIFRGEDFEPYFGMEVDPTDTADSLIAAYQGRIARSNEIIRACTDLSQRAARGVPSRPPRSMRWILAHMIEETARHAGHADIIREQIDGSVGR